MPNAPARIRVIHPYVVPIPGWYMTICSVPSEESGLMVREMSVMLVGDVMVPSSESCQVPSNLSYAAGEMIPSQQMIRRFILGSLKQVVESTKS